MNGKFPEVGVIMGSQSDWPVMAGVVEILEEFKIPYEVSVVSAHRTPKRLTEYATKARGRGIKVIIAGAGGAAHLPGMTASETILPVIGVPVQSKALNGLDSLLSINQMPPGIPVATMAINGAKNAALMAVRILAVGNYDLSQLLEKWINQQTASVAEYLPGAVIAEGKTKRILEVIGHPEHVLIESKDDLTAGDGRRHEIIAGKGKFSTTTTCNVFELLRGDFLPEDDGGPAIDEYDLAFVERSGPTAFFARKCRMIPLEVVFRYQAYGSYLERHPEVKKGDDLGGIIELFLKTSGKKWGDTDLPADDPLAVLEDGQLLIYHPHQPLDGQTPIMSIPLAEVLEPDSNVNLIEEIEDMAATTFDILSQAWRRVGGTLVDFKIEFGLDEDDNLMLADVIDADSWRVLDKNGNHLDKQPFREGEEVTATAKRYETVAKLTSDQRFQSGYPIS